MCMYLSICHVCSGALRAEEGMELDLEAWIAVVSYLV